MRFDAYEAATRATPGTAVIGSGTPTINAMPAFFIAELGDLGLITSFTLDFVIPESRLVATPDFASATLAADETAEWMILFSCNRHHHQHPVGKRALSIAVACSLNYIRNHVTTDPVPALLSDLEVGNRLKNLKGWKREGPFIVKTYEFKNFMDGISFLNAVASIAEKEEHHPDINLRYTTIKLSLQTHSEGGVTDWDFGLAEKIERALEKSGKAKPPR